MPTRWTFGNCWIKESPLISQNYPPPPSLGVMQQRQKQLKTSEFSIIRNSIAPTPQKLKIFFVYIHNLTTIWFVCTSKIFYVYFCFILKFVKTMPRLYELTHSNHHRIVRNHLYLWKLSHFIDCENLCILGQNFLPLTPTTNSDLCPRCAFSHTRTIQI